MGAQDAVQNDFKDFDVDEYKAHIDDEVHGGGEGARAHLSLAKCDPGHGGPALRLAVVAARRTGEGQAAAEAANLVGKAGDTCGENGRKNEARNHSSSTRLGRRPNTDSRT